MSLNNDATLLDVIQAHNTYFGGLSHRTYDYEHTDFAVKSLDTVYAEIIEETPALAELSAVGFTALLKDGDSISTCGNTLFINGAEETEDYTFSGDNSEDGAELVNVWYFNDDSLVLSSPIDFHILEISIMQKSSSITVERSYAKRTRKIKCDGTDLIILFGSIGDFLTEEIEISNCGTAYLTAPGTLRVYKNYSNPTVYNNTSRFVNNVNIEYIYLPNFKSLTSNYFFSGCANNNLIIEIPSVEYLSGYSAGANSETLFYQVRNVVIPQSVINLGNKTCANNQTITLYCKNATTVNDNWCTTVPSGIFSMCSDWGASINIAVAAAGWLKADFLDLFENKLRDMDDDVRGIKIPAAIYDSLTDEEFALAEDKGWTVGC